jgi:hypothetical protein
MKSNFNTEVDQFLKTVAPAAKRSRLMPYTVHIKKLRDDGCSLKQVCQFLSGQDVSVSIPGLWKFINKQTIKEKKGTVSINKQTKLDETKSQLADVPQSSNIGKSRFENRQMVALEYIKPSSENPLFKLINKN